MSSYTQRILFDEMSLFIEWYLKKYKKIELTNKENEMLLLALKQLVKKFLAKRNFLFIVIIIVET
jgi:aminoglycoside/choline kinase family phosphotransferase